MVAINRAEKDAIVEKFPEARIVRTMIQDSKRKHYYAVEEGRIMKFLNEFRRRNVIEEHPARNEKPKFKKNNKRGSNNEFRKTAR